MTKKQQLFQYLREINFTTIQDHNETYRELGKRFNVGPEYTRKVCKLFEKANKKNNADKSRLQLILEEKGIDQSQIKRVSYNAKTESYSLGLKTNQELTLNNVKDAVREGVNGMVLLNTKPLIPQIKNFTDKELHINLSDVHIGMDNSTVRDIYQWNKKNLFSRLLQCFSEIDKQIKIHNPIKVKLNFLGDITDGQDGFTTRGRKAGGHKLPQNMSNKEMLCTGIEFVNELIKFVNQYVTFIDVCYVANSNHGGIIDFAIGNTLELMYVKHDTIEFRNLTNSYNYIPGSDLGILYTHGYDEETMSRYGKLPQTLNHKHILKIERKIDLGKKNILLRGDLHRHQVKNYENFEDIMIPAFSPNSAYIAGNFDGDLAKSGF